jgi:hypothetical protein
MRQQARFGNLRTSACGSERGGYITDKNCVCHGAGIQDLSIWREIVGRRSPIAEFTYGIDVIDLQIFVEKGFFHFSPILTEQAFCRRRIGTGLGTHF